MPICLKCRTMLPPQMFVDKDDNEKLCIFCEVDKDEIVYGEGKKANKKEIVKEYDVFLKIVKEKNDVLKKALKGDVSEVPKNLIV